MMTSLERDRTAARRPSLRTLLETASGLYLDGTDSRGYARQELIEGLPEQTLDGPVRLERIADFTYRVLVGLGQERQFVLYSRRRLPRRES